MVSRHIFRLDCLEGEFDSKNNIHPKTCERPRSTFQRTLLFVVVLSPPNLRHVTQSGTTLKKPGWLRPRGSHISIIPATACPWLRTSASVTRLAAVLVSCSCFAPSSPSRLQARCRRWHNAKRTKRLQARCPRWHNAKRTKRGGALARGRH